MVCCIWPCLGISFSRECRNIANVAMLTIHRIYEILSTHSSHSFYPGEMLMLNSHVVAHTMGSSACGKSPPHGIRKWTKLREQRFPDRMSLSLSLLIAMLISIRIALGQLNASTRTISTHSLPSRSIPKLTSASILVCIQYGSRVILRYRLH